MLQTILDQFRVNGMGDLEFIIVNSKLLHAAERLHELERRVNFDVYQETLEEEVWSKLGGKKDDMFVYDRCGRLAYYVPFPLSNMFEYNYVIRAIVSAYYRNPCGGDSCERNDTLSLSEVLSQDVTSTANPDQDYTYTTQSDYIINNNYTSANESANDLLHLIEPYEDFDNYDSGEQNNSSSSFVNGTVDSTDIISSDTADSNNTIPFADDVTNSNTTQNSTANELTNTLASNNTVITNQPKTGGRKKTNDRCAEADLVVCENWSKRRLLRARMCCESNQLEMSRSRRTMCRNFGKKRCKKMHYILKCCFKTHHEGNDLPDSSAENSHPEASTNNSLPLPSVANGSQETSNNISSSESFANNNSLPLPSSTGSLRPETAVVSTSPLPSGMEEAGSTVPVPDVTCCKDVEHGKLCRVSSNGVCEEDEYVQEGPVEAVN